MIKSTKALKHLFSKLLFSFSLFTFTYSTQATIVQFETPLGNFEVNLYDQKTPLTVANFLNYVNTGAYSNSIIHRSVSNFVVQGGGFTYATAWPTTAIPPNAPVNNEPVFSNVRGTIAMAKVAGNPNSATNQWFFNLSNNAQGQAQLDSQNSGFTVFGEVVGDGMAIVDQIAALPKYDLGGVLATLPLQNYTGTGDPNETNLIITNITIIDANTDTASSLNPALNTSASQPPPSNEPRSSGGGASSFLILMLLGFVGLYKKSKK